MPGPYPRWQDRELITAARLNAQLDAMEAVETTVAAKADASAVAAVAADVDRLATQALDIREFGSVDLTGVADATDVANLAIAGSNGAGILVPPGTVRIDGSLVVPSALQTKFRFVGQGINTTRINHGSAVPFLILDGSATPSASTRRQYFEIGGFYLVGPGSGVAGSLGIQLNNGINGRMRPVAVTGFETGMLIASASIASGTYYNVIDQPVIFGCVTGLRFTEGSNSNKVFGGAIKQCTTAVQIDGVTYPTNDNSLIGTDIEGNTGTAAVVIDGAGNQLIACRFENPGATYDVWLNKSGTSGAAYGSRNQLIGNYGSNIAHSVRIRDDSLNKNNVIVMPGYVSIGDSEAFQNTHVLRATRSAATSNPFLDIEDLSSSSGTPTGLRYRARRLTSKLLDFIKTDGAGNDFSVLVADVPDLNGARIQMGSGTAAPDIEIRRYASDRWGTADYFRPGNVAALPTASANYRGYIIRVEGAAGVADATYQCRKTAADTYEWARLD